EILKKVRQIELRTNRLVNDSVAGEYHSVFKGRGMDFDEVREYTPGDEVRLIDWNVTARTGVPFIKKFTEERELTIMLIVDISASGAFGSNVQSKRELAAEVASVLAFSAIRNRDKVGLILFTDEIEEYIPPGKGRKHVLRVVREILYCEPRRRGTDIEGALDFCNRVMRRRGILFLLSDFTVRDTNPAQPLTMADRSRPKSALESLEISLRLTNRRHDLVAMRIRDRYEYELPNLGLLSLEDAETGEIYEVDTGSAHVRKRFAEMAAVRQESMGRILKLAAVDSLQLETGMPYLPALMNFFKTRGKRRI
ncbi:MAG: DUF58 domain-containing protein, partial [Candidatus Methylacidiphilales bacterium]|nr:DUF58 domain-containing protein [Candidatus Methylacidiphilales bacterium]